MLALLMDADVHSSRVHGHVKAHETGNVSD